MVRSSVYHRLLLLLLGAMVHLPSLLAAVTPDEAISIDASRVIGTIRHLNDVDNGPLCQHGVLDLTPYYKQLDVRTVRLHDVSWSYDNVLDIGYVFPNWNADPNLPESYDFAQSDLYIESITKLGINIIFRLGYSDEGKVAVRHNSPPASYDKWVNVVEHVVRHYDQGWANGLHADIRDWEIWNEPDGADFWSGTPEQYQSLYGVTARAIKKLDSSLNVGGPAIAGNLSFLEGFLKYARKERLPVDFVSWHIYTQDPDDVAARAEKVHGLLSQYGYESARSVLDEWNYGPSSWKPLFVDSGATRAYFETTQSEVGAAFDAAVLIALQDAPVDVATIYTGTTAMWGLFTPSGSPQKPYYALLAFTELLQSPRRIAVSAPSSSLIKVLAGISGDGQTVRILLSNTSANSQTVKFGVNGIPWSGPTEYLTQTVSDKLNLESTGGPTKRESPSLSEEVSAHSVVLLTLRPSRRN